MSQESLNRTGFRRNRPAVSTTRFAQRSFRALWAFMVSGRAPSRRAVAALAKLNGRKLGCRWPFLSLADPDELNLGFDDVLEFQWARSSSFQVVVIGAYDGVENDPRHLVQRQGGDSKSGLPSS